jgi:deoxyribodipyrimidine photo-lyase
MSFRFSSSSSSSSTSSSRSNIYDSVYRIRQRIVLHWFRLNDLRLHDNQALTHSSTLAFGTEEVRRCKVLPIFIFDSRIYGNQNTTSIGTLKCGVRRAKFIIESVIDLRQRLQETYRSQLLVAYGKPADVIDQLIVKLNDRSEVDGRDDLFVLNADIVCQDEPAKEERDAVREVSAIITKHNPAKETKRVQRIWGSTLYLPRKMPFDPSFRNISDRFQGFTNRMVQLHKIQETLPMPKYLPFLPRLKLDMISYMPTLQDLGYTEEQIAMADTVDPRSQIKDMKGGETAGLKHVQEYIWENDYMKDWARMRHGPIVDNKSSKFSMYLAHGCISPRTIADEARKYMHTRYANDAYKIVQQDLVKRDHCKYFGRKHSNRLFRRYPMGPVPQRFGNERYIKPKTCKKLFAAWKNGLTGYPLIDASMRELNSTGYITDRCRLLAASFLCNDLHFEWTYGAEYFESNCIDYNVFCNWVNWSIAAGLNHGHPFDRLAYKHEYKLYDPNGDYIRLWVKEIDHLPNDLICEPWKMTSDDETKYNITYGVDYPYRIVLPRVKAMKHRNDDDVQLIHEMMKRNISVKGIKGLKGFLHNYHHNKVYNEGGSTSSE